MLEGDRCVYLHRCPDGIFYVGMGQWSRAFTKNSRNDDWRAKVDSLNGEYEVVIFESGLTIEDAAALEKECIEYLGLDALTNRSKGGEHSAYGMRHSEETKRRISENNHWRDPKKRAKLSAIMTGEGNPMYGRTHSPEARKKISAARADHAKYKFTYEGHTATLTRAQFRTVTGASVSQVYEMIKHGRCFKGWRIENA